LAQATFCDGVAHTNPAGQTVWLVEPDGQKFPAEQGSCDDVLWQYDPAAHAFWTYDPAGQ
jgi:hypothetical protein